MASERNPNPPGWLTGLDERRKETAYGLIGLGALLIVAAVALATTYRWDAFIGIVVCAGLGLVLLVGGIVHQPREGQQVSDLNATRRLVLVMGGTFGFCLLVLAVGLAIGWMSDFTGGMETWQGAGWWHIWLCVGLALAGLIVMFGSMTLARSEERTNPVLRRFLYGYNTVQEVVLLAFLLAILNILIYVYYPKTVWDWTGAGLYTLSSQSVNLLQHLEKPLKIYVLLSGREGQLSEDVRYLMDNCQAVSNKVQVETLSRDRNLERLRKLVDQYRLTDVEGLLVVYGGESDEQHEFIRSQDLGEFSGQRGAADDRPRFVFKGEEALMAAVRSLEEGKAKVAIYFTQGNGELDINDSAATRIDQGAGLLRDHLQKANYDVKALRFSPVEGLKETNPNVVVSRKVPDDAAVVVVANPRNGMPDEGVKALREYMKPADKDKKPGKLIVLLDVNVQNGKMVPTGLENFLAEFNVVVGNNEILTLNRDNPLQVRVTPNPNLRTSNNLASVFEGLAIPMYAVRTVQPRTTGPAGGGGFQAESLLQVVDRAWAEDNLNIDPPQYVKDLIQNRQQELITKLSTREPLSVAVAVTESGAPTDTTDPHRFMRPPTDQKPRLMVFGDATFISNYVVSQSSTISSDLMTSALAWLRERPEAIGISPKNRALYGLSPNTDVSRMIWLPFVLMSCALVGLGLGVWVVRRR